MANDTKIVRTPDASGFLFCRYIPKTRVGKWWTEFYLFHLRDWLFIGHIKHFFLRVQRLIHWAPHIWNDADWDYVGIQKLMAYKISRLRRVIEHNMRHGGDEEIIKEMRQAEYLLARLSSDYYYDLHETYPGRWSKCTCPPETMEFVDDPGGGEYGTIVFHRCPACEINGTRWYKEMRKKEMADRVYVFNFIAKNMTKWWD